MTTPALMPPRIRRLALTTHVATSVGWLGAVATFLAIAIAGLATQDPPRANAAYLAMDVTATFVILPLALASLLTGVIQSLGTHWGLLRHWWIIAKLTITLLCTLLLLLHMQPIAHLADAVNQAALTGPTLRPLRIQLVANAGAAVFALLAATAFSIYKPNGLTSYGRRKLREDTHASRR